MYYILGVIVYSQTLVVLFWDFNSSWQAITVSVLFFTFCAQDNKHVFHHITVCLMSIDKLKKHDITLHIRANIKYKAPAIKTSHKQKWTLLYFWDNCFCTCQNADSLLNVSVYRTVMLGKHHVRPLLAVSVWYWGLWISFRMIFILEERIQMFA